MTIDPELETFFIATALRLGSNPTPKYGFDRLMENDAITKYFGMHRKDFPHRLAFQLFEAGGLQDPYARMADKYLDWLYSQKIS